MSALTKIVADRLQDGTQGDSNEECYREGLVSSFFPSTMLFLNTAERAREFAASWRRAGFRTVEVHGLMTKAEREKNLLEFRDGKCRFLVCTDACARGLDIPHVRNVVQIDFALNVVQHLHRVGRASRAGVNGMAINLYGPSSTDLVQNIIKAEKNDTNSNGIEQSFSRRRGFRQKKKKLMRKSV